MFILNLRQEFFKKASIILNNFQPPYSSNTLTGKKEQLSKYLIGFSLVGGIAALAIFGILQHTHYFLVSLFSLLFIVAAALAYRFTSPRIASIILVGGLWLTIAVSTIDHLGIFDPLLIGIIIPVMIGMIVFDKNEVWIMPAISVAWVILLAALSADQDYGYSEPLSAYIITTDIAVISISTFLFFLINIGMKNAISDTEFAKNHTKAILKAIVAPYVYIERKTFKILDINPPTCELLEMNRDDIIGQNWLNFISPKDHEKFKNDIKNFPFISVDNRYEIVDANLVQRNVTWHYAKTHKDTQSGDGIILISIDDAEKISVTRQLQKAERQFQAIMEGAAIGIKIINGSGEIVVANKFLQHMLGYDNESLPKSIFDITYHEDSEKTRNALQDIVAGKTNNIRINKRYVKSNGDVIWGNLILSVFQENPEQLILGIVEDNTFRKSAEAIIEQAALEKQQIAKERNVIDLQNRLMATLAHELRTPISLILTSTELLLNYGERIPQAQQRNKLTLIQSEIKRLVNLMNDISLIVNSEFDKTTIKSQPFDLSQTCRKICEEIGEAAGQGRIVLCNIPDVLMYNGDVKIIERAIFNLLFNALKYSRENQSVNMFVEETEDKIVIRVEDNGIGIPETDQPYIFKPFFRASNALTINGSGLGLRIVQDGIEAHGGNVTFKSIENEGTVFVITLPKKQNSGIDLLPIVRFT